MRSSASAVEGFSLLEVVVAAAIVGAVTMGGLAALGAQLRAAAAAEDSVRAVALAEHILAEAALGAYQGRPGESVEVPRLPHPYDRFRATVSATAGTPLPGLETFEVAVRWGGGERRLTAIYRAARAGVER